MNNKKYIIILILIAIMIITFSFALVSQVLVINGTASINAGNGWNISFANLDEIVVSDSTIVKELSKPNIVEDTTAINNFDVEFMSGPANFYYTFDVKNTGNLDAKLHTINLESINCYPSNKNDDIAIYEAKEVCKYIDVDLTYEDGTPVKPGDTLDSGESKKMRMNVEYNSNVAISNSVEVDNIGFNLNYIQD